MSFSDWKKRSKLFVEKVTYHNMRSGWASDDIEQVAKAAYKAGEREGRKQAEVLIENPNQWRG